MDGTILNISMAYDIDGEEPFAKHTVSVQLADGDLDRLEEGIIVPAATALVQAATAAISQQFDRSAPDGGWSITFEPFEPDPGLPGDP